MNTEQILRKKIWIDVMNQKYEQILWTRNMNRYYESEIWTDIMNQKYEQILWIRNMNRYQPEMWMDIIDQKIWKYINKKLDPSDSKARSFGAKITLNLSFDEFRLVDHCNSSMFTHVNRYLCTDRLLLVSKVLWKLVNLLGFQRLVSP